MKELFSLAQLVADATTEFLAENKGMRVEGLAQYALLIQGKVGETPLRESWEEGQLPPEKIKEAIRDLLRAAAERARARGDSNITDEDICLAIPTGQRLYPWG